MNVTFGKIPTATDMAAPYETRDFTDDERNEERNGRITAMTGLRQNNIYGTGSYPP